MSWSLRVAGALLILLGEAACSLFYVHLPAGATPFTPPAVYTRWWRLVEGCSGRSFNMGSVRWYHVPGWRFTIKGMAAGGAYAHWSNRIVLADSIIEDGESVRHEMLHAILQESGHPRSQFLGACASSVICQELCIRDADPWRSPADGYVILPPDSFEITSRAELLPREADGERWMTLWVSVRNPRGLSAAVRSRFASRTPPTFGYDLRGPTGGISGGEVATDSSTLVFGPFETKQWLFEFRVGSALKSHEVTPGSYLVRGGFAHRMAAYDTVMVTAPW